MTVHVAAATDVGHVRRRNEDHAVVGTALLTGASGDRSDRLDPPFVVAVLDGMGGHPAGDVASRLAAEGLAAADPPADTEAVAAVVDDLQAVLCAHMRDEADTTAMGTTLVAATIHDSHRALVYGVGDSSAWWWADDRLGEVLPRDRGPFGGISQVLGGSTEATDLHPHVEPITGPGRLVLCSDGLADVVAPEDCHDALAADDPAVAAAAMVTLALDRGAPDNVTVAVVDLLSPDAA